MSMERKGRFDRIDHQISRIESIFDKMSEADLESFEKALSNDGPLSGMLAEYCEHAPIPMWMKNREGKMLWFNETYTKVYGDFASVENYIGNSDSVAWSEETVLNFDENDKKVIETMEPVFCIEKLWNSRVKEYELLQVIKWPIAAENKVVVGVAGLGVGFHRVA